MNKSSINNTNNNNNRLSLELIEQVQPLNADHASAIALLEKECFPQPWSEKDIKQALTQQVFQVLGIRNHDNNILVAYVAFYHLPDEMEITNIATKQECRRKGLADALLKAVIDKGLSQGVTRILLEVRKSNEPAINLYKKFEFNSIGVRKGYYRDTNEDAILLELKLTGAMHL